MRESVPEGGIGEPCAVPEPRFNEERAVSEAGPFERCIFSEFGSEAGGSAIEIRSIEHGGPSEPGP